MQDEQDWRALNRRGLTLALLTLTYFFSYMDRQILAILQEAIKADRGMTDTFERMSLHLAKNGVDITTDKVTLGVPLKSGRAFTDRDTVRAPLVAVVNEGRVEQAGTPEEVYSRPATRWVAGFLGEIEVLPGVAENGSVSCELGELPNVYAIAAKTAASVRPHSRRASAYAAARLPTSIPRASAFSCSAHPAPSARSTANGASSRSMLSEYATVSR